MSTAEGTYVMPKMKTFELTIPADQVPKLQAFMAADTWEKAQQVRAANLEQCVESLKHCVRWALKDCGSSRVFARFLASLYNGDRVKADVSDIRALDPENFEHLMNVMRLCFETSREPHTFFENGNEIFERIIANWRFEKGRRAHA